MLRSSHVSGAAPHVPGAAPRAGRVPAAARTDLGRVGLAVVAGALAALPVSGPAAAHSSDAPTASDYQVTVTGVDPAMPGLTVRTVEAGARLELVNHTGRSIEVLGYSGEPYLRVDPDGVFENVNSPASYLNETLTGGARPPASAGPAVPPTWQRLSATPAVLWHDQRTHWTQSRPPSDVAAAPQRRHHIRDWSIPLRDEVREFAVTGTLEWVPPPATPAWWATCLLLTAIVVGLAMPAIRLPAAIVALMCGAAAIGYAVGAALDTGALGAAGVLRTLLARQTWPLLCGLATIAAGLYAARRRPAADLALGLSGACLALFAGLSNAAVFAHAVAPVPGPGALARTLVLLPTAGGLGLTFAALLHMRAIASRPASSGV